MNADLHYRDIYLIPRYFSGDSRSVLNTKVQLGNRYYEVPIVPANMKCCIDENTAAQLSHNNYFYVMHRFGDTLEFIEWANKKLPFTSISIGVKQADITLLEQIASKKLIVDYITIDIAHGHSRLMASTVLAVKYYLPNTFIIAGNIGTREAAFDLTKWGVNALKVGIGPGSVCITARKTGFITPMFSTIQKVREAVPNTFIIADGGINYNGDIAKALTAGANLVMCGKMFAELRDSPAITIMHNEHTYKEYYGSASEYNKGHINNIEGKRELIPLNDITYTAKLKEIKQDLQSAISYAGGCDLSAFKTVQWGVCSP